MELTPYEQKVFDNFSKVDKKGNLLIGFGIYKIAPDRPDRLELIEAIKKYIDVWNNIEFNSDYSKFKRIDTINRVQDILSTYLTQTTQF